LDKQSHLKKVFLLIGIFSTGTAVAQQSDLFDTGKHLQKKGQGKNIKSWALPPRTGAGQNTFLTTPYSKAKLSQQLPNGNRVYLLPVDNMPCVTPDMTRFRSMPNAASDFPQFIFRQRNQGRIPNPAPPFTIIWE
jgi:hypothetical protein